MTKSPLAIVKEKFGDKAGLVAAVEKFTSEDLWVARTNETKGLAHVSNAKLLRLHTLFTEVKTQFGSRAKLIDAILEVEKRSKDEGYKARLSKFPVPRLFDQYKVVTKRAKVAAASATKAGAPAKAAKKAPATKAPAKKEAAAKAASPAKKPAAKKTAK